MRLEHSMGRRIDPQDASLAFGRRRILIVDDSAPQRKVLAKLLQKREHAILEAITSKD